MRTAVVVIVALFALGVTTWLRLRESRATREQFIALTRVVNEVNANLDTKNEGTVGSFTSDVETERIRHIPRHLRTPTEQRHLDTAPLATEQQASVTPTGDEDRAVAVITIAFSNDPIARWFLRDPARYLAYCPPFVKALGGAAFDAGTADSVDGCSGVALWLPPGVGPDEEAMGAWASEAVLAEDQDEAFAFMDQQGEFHPSEPHWYLPLIGVDGDKQGHGYGSLLLRYATERCDRDGLSAFLEATNPRNKALYERHGFETVGVIQAGSSPPSWPMRREPRK